MHLVVEPEAQADIDSAVAWYDSQDFGLGSAFLAEIRATFKRIAGKPSLYPFHKPGLRRAKVRRFPYNVFYSQRDDAVFVHAAMHNSRDPDMLDKRLN